MSQLKEIHSLFLNDIVFNNFILTCGEVVEMSGRRNHERN